MILYNKILYYIPPPPQWWINPLLYSGVDTAPVYTECCRNQKTGRDVPQT